MSTPKWDETHSIEPAWDDTHELPSQLESGVRGLAQGASLGFADEATAGLESLFTDKTYQDALKESRDNYHAAEKANPATYMTGNVAGAVGTAFIPGLNVAKAGTFAGRLGTAALGGGLTGLGNSEAADAKDLAMDTGAGALMGMGTQFVGEKVVAPAIQKVGSFTDRIMQAANNKSPTANRLLSKAANLTSGVDEDAAMRQIQRPLQTAAAQSDDFAFNMGKQAVHDTESLGYQLGQDVSSAKNQFLNSSGDKVVEGTDVLKSKVADFLAANKPSTRGFSGISDSQRMDLMDLQKMLDGPINGEDLVKVRDYLDHVERLAGKYDQDGTGPFIGFLKNLRGTADGILDRVDPNIDNANKAFSQYKADTGLLRSATNEGQSERMIGNLYGANKGAQQEAAGRLFMPDTLEAAKDIASNKAFTNATRPGGDNYFRRGALAAVTMGTSEIATNPHLWQKGLRGMGRLEQAIKSNPQMFGKYSTVLADAVSRGPQALAATHFILSQKDAQYRELSKSLDQDDNK